MASKKEGDSAFDYESWPEMRNNRMKSLLAVALVAMALSACSVGNAGWSATTDAKPNAVRSGDSLTKDERHRLYTAALAASESPLGSDLFTDVCKKIGIYDADGTPNDRYMPFVTEHVNWGMKSETQQFRQEINTKEKARDYIDKHLPR